MTLKLTFFLRRLRGSSKRSHQCSRRLVIALHLLARRCSGSWRKSRGLSPLWHLTMPMLQASSLKGGRLHSVQATSALWHRLYFAFLSASSLFPPSPFPFDFTFLPSFPSLPFEPLLSRRPPLLSGMDESHLNLLSA